MLGHRGIWVDGWKAVTRHQKNDPWGDDEWELYHVAEDFSESNNLAAENPEKLRELVDRWWVEAGRYGVLPLDDRSFQLGGPTQRPGGPHNGLKYPLHAASLSSARARSRRRSGWDRGRLKRTSSVTASATA